MEKPGKKVCTQCGEEKPAAEFSLRNASKDGLAARCKSCLVEYRRRYREENKEKLSANKRRYYEENKEKLCANKRRYREENKEKVSASKRRYYEENKEKVSAKDRRYYEENKEKLSANRRRYCEENKEKVSANKRRYREALPDPYVKRMLGATPNTPIPQPLIEAKRFHLRILRELRKD